MTTAGWLDWTTADIALLVAVTAMGVAVAYLRDPEHKATVLMLPVPFSLAMVSVGRPIEAANVLAIPSLFGYTFLVWLLHAQLRLPAREGRPHRTPLPVWIKTPAVTAVISGLIEIKHLLGGRLLAPSAIGPVILADPDDDILPLGHAEVGFSGPAHGHRGPGHCCWNRRTGGQGRRKKHFRLGRHSR